MRSRFTGLLVLVLAVAASPLAAQCTLQLSESGIVRINSGEERTLTWNAVPGASSYLVETLIEGLNDPSGPDFTFGAPYTESRNIEGRNMTSVRVKHAVLYKIRFRYIVTAMNRESPSFQPCKADVLYVVSADDQMASVASRRIVPIAGKSPGMNGANYSTTLIISGGATGMPMPGRERAADEPRLYRGRIVFRPLGTVASDSDPSIEYALHAEETLLFEDVMADLGASGIGTLEIIPRSPGVPTPMVDAIIENRLPDHRRAGVRIPAIWGRDLLDVHETVTVGIRNTTDARLAIGVRSFAGPGHLLFQHIRKDGKVVAFELDGHTVEAAHRFSPADTTLVFALRDLFPGPFEPGDRITARYMSLDLRGGNGVLFPAAKGALLFVTETGNDFNTPNMVYREAIDGSRYANGFDRFVVY
jgi:hypothetical protein